MTLTRRRLLGGGATLAAAAAAAAVSIGEAEPAAAACTIAPAATPESVVMSRLSFGPTPTAVSAFRALGKTDDERYTAWVRRQLNPAGIPDAACDNRLATTQLKIRYNGVSEVRPLDLIKPDITVQYLWASRVKPRTLAWEERMRPYDEVRAATWIRAVYSERQLFEVLVDFWHNHFNVKATSDQRIAATWPIYDRIMRTHALGNFTSFVTAVAQSTAMMYYLDNASNRVSGGEGGNENFARELFELHTLGSDNYLKFYDQRSQIGTVSWGDETFVRGYIDDDVYEASYALTGWTVADGHWERQQLDDGSFYFDVSWHQPGGKRVLAANFDEIIENKASPIQEGYEVIRRVTRHLGTARTLCTKLVRRFVADDPPQALIDQAVNVWMANRDAPDQIKRVLEVILLSSACKTTFGQKVRRPLDAIWAYLRATGANLPSDQASVAGDASRGGYWGSLFYGADQSGHRLFGWDTPTGHPDTAAYWANTNGLLARWNMPYNVTQSWGGSVAIDVVAQTPAGATCEQLVDYWVARLIGFPVAAAVRKALVDFIAQGGPSNQPPWPLSAAPDYGDPEAIKDRIRALVQLIAASPEFSLC